MPADLPRFLSLADVSNELNLSIRVVRTLVERGEILGIKMGREWRVEVVELENYIARQYEREREKKRKKKKSDDA